MSDKKRHLDISCWESWMSTYMAAITSPTGFLIQLSHTCLDTVYFYIAALLGYTMTAILVFPAFPDAIKKKLGSQNHPLILCADWPERPSPIHDPWPHHFPYSVTRSGDKVKYTESLVSMNPKEIPALWWEEAWMGDNDLSSLWARPGGRSKLRLFKAQSLGGF